MSVPDGAKDLSPVVWYDKDDDPLRPLASRVENPQRPIVGVGDGTEPRPHADENRPNRVAPRFTLEAEQAAAKALGGDADERVRSTFMEGYDLAMREIAEREALLAAAEPDESDTTSTNPSGPAEPVVEPVGDVVDPEAPSREPDGEPEGTPPAPPDPTPVAAGKGKGTPARG